MPKVPDSAKEFHQYTIPSLEPTDFFAQAEPLLAEYTSTVIDNIVPQLTELEGRLHPLGFVVFPLDDRVADRDDGSSLRLHVWPEGSRKSTLVNAIHDHNWHIISRVLTPEPYQDTRYDVQVASDAPMTEAERIRAGLRTVFRGHYPPGPQELRPVGTYARVKDIGSVVVQSGQYNRIIAGEYHIDTIPDDRTVATLCLTSPRLADGDGPYVIIDGPADNIEMARRPIPPDYLRYIRDALQEATA